MNLKKSLKTIVISIGLVIGVIFWGMVFTYFGLLGYWFVKYPDPSCTNSNRIFETYTYKSPEYKNELIRLLKKTKSLDTDYWFKRYIDENHIEIIIQNDSICATGHITIDDSKLKNDGGFMKHLMEVKGSSYNGPLVGMTFDFENNKQMPNIYLTAVEDIID